jgi:hypothetical protein
MNSASLCSMAGRYNNPIPPRFLAPIDCLKIPAQGSILASCVVKDNTVETRVADQDTDPQGFALFLEAGSEVGSGSELKPKFRSFRGLK